MRSRCSGGRRRVALALVFLALAPLAALAGAATSPTPGSSNDPAYRGATASGSVRVKLLSRKLKALRRAGRAQVSVQALVPAQVFLTATAKPRGKKVKVGTPASAHGTFASPSTQTLSVPLTKVNRKLIRKARRAQVRITGLAVYADGTQEPLSIVKTLRS